jgi:hypothetical protein
MLKTSLATAIVVALAAILAACGGSSSQSKSPSAQEAASASAGDIPDNQAFVAFRDPKLGFSMKYPEGWAHRRSGQSVTFRNKDNVVRVAFSSGSAPTAAGVESELDRQRLKRAQPAQPVTVGPNKAIKVVYTTIGPPNPVSGKRPALSVDRYELAKGGKVATVDLSTPKGVDNVDAYRLMIESFRWR